jgi:DNA-binding CsgD family transcriptional regulator
MENPQEILDKRSAPGLLLFDLQGRLFYFSQKTLEIIPTIKFSSIRSSQKTSLWPPALSQLLHEAMGHAKQPKTIKSNKLSFHSLFFKSNIPYSLRAFLIGPNRKNKESSHILVLTEPIVQGRGMDLENLKQKFNLTKREVEVVKLICGGFSNKKISEKLFVSEYIVKDHLKHIMAKLGANSRNQIVCTLLNPLC